MSAEYEVWNREAGRADSTLHAASDEREAAECWAAENWSIDACEGDTVDVVVIEDGGTEVAVYTVERTVEYEAFHDASLSARVAAEIEEQSKEP